MSNAMSQAAVPPAWYPDPADPAMLRYWDGLGWTGQLAPNPHTALTSYTPASQFATVTPLTPSSPFAAIAPSPFAAVTGPTVTLTDLGADITDPHLAYIPMSRTGLSAGKVRVLRASGPTSTPAAWGYAVLPLLALPFAWFLPSVATEGVFPLARLALLAVLVVGLVALASLDHAELQRREVPNAPSALVGLIPVVYVADRALRVGRSGAGVLLLSLLVQGVVAGVVIWRVLPALPF